jgi:hypothetical protein
MIYAINEKRCNSPPLILQELIIKVCLKWLKDTLPRAHQLLLTAGKLFFVFKIAASRDDALVHTQHFSLCRGLQTFCFVQGSGRNGDRKRS